LWWRRRPGGKAQLEHQLVPAGRGLRSVWLPEWVMKDTPSPVQQLNTDQD
jgi:hypothetical protein